MTSPTLPTLSDAERRRLEPEFRVLIEKYLSGHRTMLPDGQSYLSVSNQASFVDQAWRIMELADITPPEAPLVLGEWLRDLFDTNTSLRNCWRQWSQGLHPVRLEEFPFQRLVTDDDTERAALLERWQAAGSKLVQGDMVAAKWDSVWLKLSAFGYPFEPFSWTSWARVEDLDRREASELGLALPRQNPRIESMPRPERIEGLGFPTPAKASASFSALGSSHPAGDAGRLLGGMWRALRGKGR